MRRISVSRAAMLVAVGFTFAGLAQAAAHATLYNRDKSIPLGSPDRWDYLTYEPTSDLLYVAHENEIDVVNVGSGKLSRIPIPGANGIAVVPDKGKGYAGSRSHRSIMVFDLKTGRVLKELPADEDTDGAFYDSFSQRVFVVEGDPQSVTVIDTTNDTVVKQLGLGGKPEFAASDGKGNLFINLTDKREIARLDTKAATVTGRYSIPDCTSPHGMAIDRADDVLFSTCTNSKMEVVDAKSGKVLATLAIGAGSDAAAYDSVRKRAFSSNGDGSLTVVGRGANGAFEVKEDLKTEPLARTMTLDERSGRLFLAGAERVESDPNATDARRRYSVVPGSAHVLVYSPAP